MLEEKTTKKQNFLAGAAVLSLATMIVKVIGMFFKIPLNRLIGEANYGYFTTAYDIYTVLLMISTTGLPVAMSRMISEARALNNGKQVRQIYRVSLYGLPVHWDHRLGADAARPEAAGQHDGEPERHGPSLRSARPCSSCATSPPAAASSRAGEHGSYGRQPDHRGAVQALPLASALPGSS